jgi:hypothetical protein
VGDLLVIMAQFTLKITLGNEAMQTGSDIAESLREIANRIETYDSMKFPETKIRDINGNSVGTWKVK